MAEAVAAPGSAPTGDKPRGRRLRVVMETRRKDHWWVPQAVTFVVFTSFIVYATWAAFQGEHYTYGSYLSPFYAPELWGNSPHAWFGPAPTWIPAWVPFTPALLILPFPGGFRFTCYYYRGAYYKSFWADPPACSVGEPRKSYWGEKSFPLIMQNFHRYFLRLSYIVWFFLLWDAIMAFWFDGHFGVGLGSLIMSVNVIFIACYIFGCHAFRHLIGGALNQPSKHPTRKKLYDCSSCLNSNHKKWAWASLCSVGFADIYVRLCSMGIWHDWRLF